ncbi:PEP/pyruvate-binding domain-containing protein [Pseudomaricurvus sp.]|uniref:PEP/pyruvate-binding domain-containing protein n=1 Tax=Pseudomaricurvus sp. TaxID=2004510 RepID=UPI003F6D1BB2
MPLRCLALLLTITLTPTLSASTATEPPPKSVATYQQWIKEMKEASRGPFERIRWFCNDGTVLPPKSYACASHGGGRQHGEWNQRTLTLREHGYKIATFLADMEPETTVNQPDFADTYGQLLVEKYLIAADDGWILRRALFYRGAIQEEGERAGAKDLLQYMADHPPWIGTHYLSLRTGVRLLAHGEATASSQKVRQESAALSSKDKGFMKLRAKIHGAPDAEDAQRVREYAAQVSDPALAERYQNLATMIDEVYQAEPLAEELAAINEHFSGAPWLQTLLNDARSELQVSDSAFQRYQITGQLLADLRDNLPRVKTRTARLRILDLGLDIENENFRASTDLRDTLPNLTRHQRVQLLKAGAQAAYGAGLIKQRELHAATDSLAQLSADKVDLSVYLKELRYLGRIPGWATQNMRFFFYEAMQKLAQIEPQAILFIQDQLRGSPLLFYSQVLDTLSQDSNRLAGVRHTIFGKSVGVGFNALNPGIAKGELHANPDIENMDAFSPQGVYLLPETVSDLPPIAGILTAGEGNPLSHVQLLARNLGIPNVSVNEDMIPQLRAHDGEQIVMAVSPSGLVELSPYDSEWQQRFADNQSASGVVIRPDIDKLDLSVQEFISLDDLRAKDSGRTVGPKAAKLGELRHSFPSAVAPGVAIPFGIFKAEVLDNPYKNSGQSIYQWMVDQYRSLETLPENSAQRKNRTEDFRNELYQLILNTKPSDQFRSRLATAMKDTFGTQQTGVFVRSDTNVEDLPGFTGAGLNLTLPNVVGFDALMQAIARVWASPFTERAFAWRQSHMESPEHVYTSILLLQAVPSDKSGVLVTQDLDTGDLQTISVAVNEGLGGAVDGQAAESLRINTRDGSVRVMATATAPERRVLNDNGGIHKLPSSGADAVLQPKEIERLIVFARDELPIKFPTITDDDGNPAAADVEFGFLNGELRLFQIRPFLESKGAQNNAYLQQMDKTLNSTQGRTVNLQEVPQ